MLEEVLASMRPEELGEKGVDNSASLWLPMEMRKGLIFWPAVCGRAVQISCSWSLVTNHGLDFSLIVSYQGCC